MLIKLKEQCILFYDKTGEKSANKSGGDFVV
jgi:hypothetical protein